MFLSTKKIVWSLLPGSSVSMIIITGTKLIDWWIAQLLWVFLAVYNFLSNIVGVCFHYKSLLFNLILF
mgnify:CR=1 FL=1